MSQELDCTTEKRRTKMNALIINCSPVRTGATAEIVELVSDLFMSS